MAVVPPRLPPPGPPPRSAPLHFPAPPPPRHETSIKITVVDASHQPDEVPSGVAKSEVEEGTDGGPAPGVLGGHSATDNFFETASFPVTSIPIHYLSCVFSLPSYFFCHFDSSHKSPKNQAMMLEEVSGVNFSR